MIDHDTRAGIRRAFNQACAEQGLEQLKIVRSHLRDELDADLDRAYRDAETRLTRERSSGLTVDDARHMFALVQNGGARR